MIPQYAVSLLYMLDWVVSKQSKVISCRPTKTHVNISHIDN